MIEGVHCAGLLRPIGQIREALRIDSFALKLDSPVGKIEEYSVSLLYDQWVRHYKKRTADHGSNSRLTAGLTPISNFSRDPVLCRPV